MSGGTGGNLGPKRRVGVAKCQMYSSFFLSSCRCGSVLRRRDRGERREQNVNAHFLLLLVSCAPNSTTITSPPPQAHTHAQTHLHTESSDSSWAGAKKKASSVMLYLTERCYVRLLLLLPLEASPCTQRQQQQDEERFAQVGV